MWSKSGAIICRKDGERLVAARIDGRYWMYWGEGDIYIAISDNLVDWEPLVSDGEPQALRYLFGTRRNRFDSALVEPGPPAILSDTGILFIYNSKNSRATGDPALPEGTYAAGQVLYDPNDPTAVLRRSRDHFM
jgi:predicted GH43/DUF377 family glycosyl hydrolase